MAAKSLLSELLSVSPTAQPRINADTLACAAHVCASWTRRSVLFTGSVKSLLSLDDYNEDVDADDDLDMDSYTASMTSPFPRPVSPQVAVCAARQGSSRAEAQDVKETRWRHEVVTPKIRANAGGGSGKAAYDVVHGVNGAVQRISVDGRAHSPRHVSKNVLPHPRHAETVALMDRIGRTRVGGGGNAEATSCSSGHPVLGLEGLGRYFHHQRPSWALSAVVSPRHKSLSLGRCRLSWLLTTVVLLLCPHAP